MSEQRNTAACAWSAGWPSLFSTVLRMMSSRSPFTSKSKGEVPTEEYSIPFGQADIKRPGKHVTVVTTSYTVQMALRAAETRAGEGIEVEVVDPRTIVPLDERTILDSVRRTGRLVIVHEAWRQRPKTC